MAEFEDIEIPEGLLEEIAGGTLSPNTEGAIRRTSIRLRDSGKSKRRCFEMMRGIYGSYGEDNNHADIAAIVEEVYAPLKTSAPESRG